MAEILNEIIKANDIKNVSPTDYKRLAKEIRHFLIKNISKTGGHLASNLGAVELTMALHLYMNFPEDKLIWDVGHQAYTHKILTGRKDDFNTLRTFEGLSGFPKAKESICDAFDTGHSSTSISAAMGIVKARDLKGEDYKVTAVIGDGALSGGLAFEALNNAARLNSNFMIILNDNNMSISENVGGMANYLGKLRTNSSYNNFKSHLENAILKIPVGEVIMDKLRKSKDSIKRLVIPGMLFEDMGITYIGPIDGHNINELMTAFYSASKAKKAVLVHVITKKGKGYKLAEENPSKYHGVDTFDVKTGENIVKKNEPSYTEIFSKTMLSLGEDKKEIVAISAAMPQGTGLNSFKEKYPDRFVDVGIAEEHAVTFAAGLASSGMKPVVAIYSTFLQRSYDQIIHDVCITKKPVIFAIDRAGLVGNDGETHQGIFDISFLSHMPNMTLLAPKNGAELEQMLRFASDFDGPIAIRYPRGSAYSGLKEYNAPIEYGKSEIIYRIDDKTTLTNEANNIENKITDNKLESDIGINNILILAVGSMVEVGTKIYERLITDNQKVTLVNVRFITPMDENMMHEMAKSHNVWVTMEENVKAGGYGESVTCFLMENDYHHINHINISLPNMFIEQGEVSILKDKYDLNEEVIYNKIKRVLDAN